MIYPFMAKRRGKCAFCGEHFDEGERVAYLDDDLGHEDCARETEEETIFEEAYER